jgi:hypothetical protein
MRSVSWQLQLYMFCHTCHIAVFAPVLVLPVLLAENLLPGFRVVINDGPDACESCELTAFTAFRRYC